MRLLGAFCIGLLLPTVVGWLLVTIAEYPRTVLFRLERWVLGFVMGSGVMTLLSFVASAYAGLPLTLAALLSLHTGVLVALAPCWLLLRRSSESVSPVAPPSGRGSAASRIATALLGLWTAAKIALTGIAFLFVVPTYIDDSYTIWNLRAKVFYVAQAFTLDLPGESADALQSGANSYPPSLPLAKTWLAALAGRWSEPLINGIHLVWYLAALALCYTLLRRCLSTGWSLVGVYILASLPLYLIQGTNAYADVFLSVHILAAVGLLFHALRAQDRHERRVLLTLSGVITALMAFTKNEGLLLYLVPLLILQGFCLAGLSATGELRRSDLRAILLCWGAALLLVLVPWLGFKVLHGLAFGNRQSAAHIGIGWQPGVVRTIVGSLFGEGNWSLFFSLFVGVFLFEWRAALRLPLAVLTASFVGLFLLQVALFTFTGLSREALNQTGYSRGIVHIVPVGVMLVTLLLERLTRRHLDRRV